MDAAAPFDASAGEAIAVIVLLLVGFAVVVGSVGSVATTGTLVPVEDGRRPPCPVPCMMTFHEVTSFDVLATVDRTDSVYLMCSYRRRKGRKERMKDGRKKGRKGGRKEGRKDGRKKRMMEQMMRRR